MQVKYVGPSPSVMAGREGYVILFPKGVPTDVPDDEWAKSLCEQDTFQEVKSKKADPAATTTAEEAE